MTMAGQLSCRSLRLWQVKMSTSQRLIGREEGNALAKLREILGRKEEGEGAAASVANTCGREECADHYFLPLSKCENGHDLPTLETVDATHLRISLKGGGDSMVYCEVLGKV